MDSERRSNHLGQSAVAAPGSTGAQELNRQGEQLAAAGDLAAALVCFSAALQADPGNSTAHNNIAVVKWMTDDLDGALVHIARAVAGDPHDPNTIVNAVQIFLAAQRPDLARALCQDYLHAHPGHEQIQALLQQISEQERTVLPVEGGRGAMRDGVGAYGREELVSIAHRVRHLKSVDKLLSMVRELLSHHERITFIDVGSANGMILERLGLSNVYAVGIDPLMDRYLARSNDTPINRYAEKIRAVIDLGEPRQIGFNVHQELACSSCLEVNRERIVADPAHGGDRFYLPEDRAGAIVVEERVQVDCTSLADIIRRLKLEDDIIHFLKVDAQGVDLRVVKSGGDFLRNNVLFVMIETTREDISAGTLYKDSSVFTEDRAYFASQGFRLIALETLLQDDADALFYNAALLGDAIGDVFALNP